MASKSIDDMLFPGAEAAREEQQKIGNSLDYLIHKVFAQNESGVELLKLWEKALILEPTARPGDDLLTVGINEGTKNFIRNILITVNKVEQEK